MTPIVAIDPGCPGAAVALDEYGLAVWCASWHEVQRELVAYIELTYEDRESVRPLALWTRTLAGVGAYLGSYVIPGTAHLIAEGLFVHSMSRAQAAIDLGKSVGWLTAGLRESALSYSEVKASEWRPAMLGCPANEDSDEAERLALLRWRPLWRGSLRENPHVAEAKAIADFRRMQLRHDVAQPSLVQPRTRRSRRL